MNSKEKLIIGDFIDGSAIVYKKEKMNLVKGLMFENGSTKFFDVIHFGDFKDGLAMIDDGKKVGFINRQGEWVIPPKYEIGEDFSEGLTFVRKDGKTLLINSSGKLIKKLDRHTVTGRFSEGFAQCGYLTIDGESILMAFINQNGIVVTSFDEPRQITNPHKIIDEDDDLSCNLARFCVNGKYGYRTVLHAEVIPPIYDTAQRFTEELAAVSLNDKCGFIDIEGKVQITFEFEYANRFSEGLAAVEYNGKMGMINKNCDPVIPFEFFWLSEFKNGCIEFCTTVEHKSGKFINYAELFVHDRWGLMDKNMNIVIPEKYSYIKSYVDGICEVALNARKGVVDRNGNELFSDLLVGCEYNHLLN
jgi:hypothetical protein